MKFLPKEAIEQPDALAKVFEEMREAYNRNKVRLTDEQSKQMISILMASDEKIDAVYNDFNQHFPMNGFFARCSIFPIKYEKRLLVWLAVMTHQFNIGGMILIGYYIQWFVHTEKEKSIILKNELEQGDLTLTQVCERVFPFGVFSEELVHEFWDKQKVHAHPDNLVDHSSAQLSFMTEPISSTP